MRVFFDTNVLVSAFLARGLCADLLRLGLVDADDEGVLGTSASGWLIRAPGQCVAPSARQSATSA